MVIKATELIEKIKHQKLKSYVLVALAILTLLIGFVNYFTAMKISSQEEIGKLFPVYLIVIDILLIVSIISYILYQIYSFLRLKKKDLFTYKFQTKIVLIVSSICIFPVLIIIVFSLSFFNVNSKTWFNNVVDIALNESLEISNVYINEHREGIKDDLFNMKKFTEKNTRMILMDSSEFDSSFSGNAAMLSLTDAVIFLYNKSNKTIKILSKTPVSFFSSIEKFKFEEHFKPNDMGYNLIINEDDNYIRAITPIETIPNTYILVGKLMNDKVIRHVKNAEHANSNYHTMKEGIERTKGQFYIVFILIIALIFLSVILLTMYYSSKIFLPIVDIVLATRQVAQGRYNILLDTKNTNEEMAVLLKSFNRMVRLIGKKNSDLNMSHQIVTTKKKFLETILGALPAATIVLDVNKKIKLFNKSARTLFSERDLNNADIAIICPELVPVLEKLHEVPDDVVNDTVSFKKDKKNVKFYVFASIEKSNDEINGYILNVFSI